MKKKSTIKTPDSVKIGGRPYTVIVRPDPVLRDHVCHGTIDTNATEITLNDDLSEIFEAEVLLHEIIHGVFYQAGVGTGKEKMVRLLSNGLLQVILDNPDLVAYLRRVRTFAQRGR